MVREEHRKRNSKCALVVAAMKRKKVVENLEESETVVVAEDKPVKVVSVSTKIKAGKAKPKTRRGAAEETVTEVETATEIATETETGTEAEKEVEEIPEPLVAAKPKKGKGKVTSKRGKGKAVEEVELLDDSENADKVQGLTPESVKDQEEPITKSKRGSKGPVDSNPKRARKALETAVIANIPVPDKNDPKKLGAYMELIHDSTPVNSILTKEMLVTIFEENSEKTLADFLGVLGQKAGRVLDELMAIE